MLVPGVLFVLRLCDALVMSAASGPVIKNSSKSFVGMYSRRLSLSEDSGLEKRALFLLEKSLIFKLIFEYLVSNW